MKKQYIEKNFRRKSLERIAQAEAILDEYAAQGFDLTLRQLYYQFVARDLIPNSQREYQKLGSTINDARLAGLIDWDMIEDRTRNLRGLTHWDSPAQIIRSAAASFKLDPWEDQDAHIEVWIEKDALVGVIADVCNDLHVDYFSCRGYTSQSEMYRAARRLRCYDKSVILHFGDHDPSGIDMSRDIADRMALFGAYIDFKRMALNMDQVDEYNPPPNPAKMTDSRFDEYVDQYGSSCWELDALEPKVITALIKEQVEDYIDRDAWDATERRQEEQREMLDNVSANWETLSENWGQISEDYL